MGISGFQQLHRAVNAVTGPQQNAGEPRPASGRISGRSDAGQATGADYVLSGRFTEQEPEEASSLLNLRPCRIRYDVTKEWTNFCGLKRGTPCQLPAAYALGVPFGEDNSERAVQSGVKQRLNSAST